MQSEIEKLPNSFYSHAEAIFHLSEVGIDVKQTRVADWLGVSRANVSQVIGRMQNSGLIEFGDELKLTKKGDYLAKMVARRHRIVERFLSEILDLPWDQVYEETKKWENVLSSITEDAMLKILGNPKTGLFGNPIPYSNYFEGPMDRLCDVDTNKKYSIIKISEELKRKFPGKKIEIFSSDTMNKKDSKEKIDKIINNETHILVGTQLISKGFHFPSLNCIVVVDIDLSSQGHDLRGAEKNLQLYHQLSGRAGRTGKPATVYFQTYENNTKMISEITSKNPDIFLERELEIRKKNKLPPFQRFISLILTGDNEIKLEKEAINFKNFIENKIEGKILGPVNAPLFRLKRKFRIRFLIRGLKSMKLQSSLAKIIPKYKFSSGIKLSVDVDPINFN